MYVLIVIILSGRPDGHPTAGFTQEFDTRDACYFAMNETDKEINKKGGSSTQLVMHCVSKERPMY